MTKPSPLAVRPEHWALFNQLLDPTLMRAERPRDPVSVPWSYTDPADQEVSALLAATLAYGRVDLFLPKIREVLVALGGAPALSMRRLASDADEYTAFQDRLAGFVYRMTRGQDVAALCLAMGRTLQSHGSLGALFLKGVADNAPDYRQGLSHFVHTLRELGERDARGFYYLLADPAKGGACKRLNMFLRWMVRGPDEVDLGLWSELDTSRLVMPIDTHIARISAYIGLSTRKTNDWKQAALIARSLMALDPDDPLKYDFALCHLGISGACPSRRVESICEKCPIQPACIHQHR